MGQTLIVLVAAVSTGLLSASAQDTGASSEFVQKQEPGGSDGEKTPEQNAAERKEQAEQATREMILNVLQRAAGGLQRSPGNPARDPRIVPQDDERPRIGRDHIDGRAPIDNEMNSLLTRARRRSDQQEWNTATDLLQAILDRSPGRLVMNSTGRFVPIDAECTRLLAGLPREALDRYRLRYGPVARRMLTTADETGDFEQMADVATRYFHTPSGQHAARRLVMYHLDRAEPISARRWLRRLIDSTTAEAEDDLEPFRRLESALLQFGKANTENPPEDNSSLVALAASLDRSDTARVPDNQQWMLFGHADRRAVWTGRDPVLLSRWSVAMSDSERLDARIRDITSRLTAAGRSTLPAAIPVTVGNRIAFRTLHGIVVVDARSGKLQWEVRTDPTPEALLLGLSKTKQTTRTSAMRAALVRNAVSGSPVVPDNDPVTSLIFRDGLRGLLSTDGRRLFVVQDQAVLPPAGYSPRFGGRGINDPHRRSWGSNTLAAYDLETGRLIWKVGGRQSGDAFDLPLAGHFFAGPPVPVDNELYSVAEADGEIRLVAIDPGNGRPRWTCLLAYADLNIDRDFHRRNWTAQPAIAGGTIVCPTTLGWTVAVDRLRRSIVWAHRYTKPVDESAVRNVNRHMVELKELNARWPVSAPIVVGDRVVYSPQEEPILECLDVISGERIWRIQKDKYLYLGGVVDGDAILVGKRSVEAVAIGNGRRRWKYRIPESMGVPTGLGVVTTDRFFVPLSTDRLLTVDLPDGTGRLLSGSAPPGTLGNLTFYRGQLLSLSSSGLTAFSTRGELANASPTSTDEMIAAIQHAEVRKLDGDFVGALALVDNLSRDRLAPQHAERLRRLEFDSLLALLRSDEIPAAQSVTRLRELAESDADRLLVAEAEVDRHLARSDSQSAFDALIKLVDSPLSGMLEDRDNPRLRRDADVWLASKLHDAWRLASGETADAINSTIEHRLEGDESTDAGPRDRLLQLFAFHPSAARQFDRRAARDSAMSFFESEFRLLQIMHDRDPRESSAVRERLARFYEQSDLPGDARRVRVAGQHTDSRPDGRSPADRPPEPDHDADTWAFERAGSAYSASLILADVDHGWFPVQTLQNLRVNFDQVRRRLQFVRQSDDVVDWSVVLASVRSSAARPEVAVFGHTMLVAYGNVLHCLSPADRRVMWTRRFSKSVIPGQTVTAIHAPGQYRFVPAGSLSTMRRATRNAIVGANDRAICFRSNEQLRVLDPMTGADRWTLDGLSGAERTFCTREAVYLVDPDGNAAAHDIRDGATLPIPDLDRTCKQTIACRPNGLVIIDHRTGIFGLGASTQLRVYEPATDRELWSRSWRGEAGIAFVDQDTIAVRGDTQRIDLLDPASGALTTIATGGLPGRSAASIVGDTENLYVLSDGTQHTTVRHFGNLSSLSVNGVISAYDRNTGRQRWTRELSEQQLLLEHFDHMPVLVLSWRRMNPIRGQGNRLPTWTVKVAAIDKRTGQIVVNEQWETARTTDVRSLRYNGHLQRIELQTYYERIRLTKADSAAVEPQPSSTATEER